METILHILKDAFHSMEVTSLSATIKLAVSFVLGSIIGIERQTRRQNAGMRTFALIGMASTAAMLLSIWIPQSYPHFLNGDPGRIAAQILTGIGFLGAGAIIQSKGSVYGLTTAASIWVVAIIGMCVGAGMYYPAITLTVFALFVLMVLERLDRRRSVSGEVRMLVIHYETPTPNIDQVKEILKKHAIYLFNISIKKDIKKETSTLLLKVQVRPNTSLTKLFDEIQLQEAVSQINLEVV